MASVAVVHDYLTQRGGAERVVVALAACFPDAPIHTSFYEPEQTFTDFDPGRIQSSVLNRIGPLRRDPRRALPLLAPTFTRRRVKADAVICSSSGWAHGTDVDGAKIVYCHAPARWLYQSERYLVDRPWYARAALAPAAGVLRRWDQRAAATADRYLANSSAVADAIHDLYGIHATLVPPPVVFDVDAPQQAVPGVEPGYWLSVSRPRPYKNLDAVIGAFARLPGQRLVLAGGGRGTDPSLDAAAAGVTVLDEVTEAELRWLYASSRGLVSAAHEDFGLTPVEAASFGRPAVVLRGGGFLDTVVDQVTGAFFDRPEPAAIARAVDEATQREWSEQKILLHAERFSLARFDADLRAVIADAVEERATPVSDIESSVRRFIADLAGGLGDDELPVDRHLIEDELLDSLGIFALVSHLEGQFSITIEPEEVVIGNFATIAAVSELVEPRRSVTDDLVDTGAPAAVGGR